MVNFDLIEEFGHEQVIFCSNKQTGLKAIIAIHDTTLGPALGGTRMLNYENYEAALKDVLRLSRGMTYKSAVAGLNFGGGKAVILGNPDLQKNEMLFRSFGKYVEGLAGRFITAEDVGTDVMDMEFVRMETKYVTGIPKSLGGSGDPAPVTAYGVYVGIKSCANELWGNDSLKGKRIAIQGAGQVARHLCDHLYNEGADLIITDINEAKIKNISNKLNAEVVSPEKIYETDADIFSPCALGSVINDKTISKMNFQIIAGSANNQLEDEVKHSKMLFEKGILYAPDYVINSGGLINVANELEGYRQDRAMKHAENIYDILKKVFKVSKEENVSTNFASNKIAEERIRQITGIKKIYSGTSNFSGRLGELSKR